VWTIDESWRLAAWRIAKDEISMVKYSELIAALASDY
jgi:hypothetical protein